MALPAKKLGLAAVAVTAWLLVQLSAHLSSKLAEKATWETIYAKYQRQQTLTQAEESAVQHLEHTLVAHYLELAAAKLAQDSSALYDFATSKSTACKMTLLTEVMTRGWNMLSVQEARAFEPQVRRRFLTAG